MGRKRSRPGRTARSAKQTNMSLIGITLKTPGVFCPSGYHPLTEAPEVAAAVWRISDMIGAMTIQQFQNGSSGDVRIRDNLSRKVDIDPWSLGTRQSWVTWIVSTMLTEGESVVLPQTSVGTLTDLPPAPGAKSQLRGDGTPYEVVYKGVAFDPDEVLHFRLRPDPAAPWRGMGPRVQLQAVVDSLIQTAATKQAFMSSDYKPPIIIGVNSDADLGSKDLRSQFLEHIWSRNSPDEPVVVPADLVTVTQAHYLSLSDLAIKDGWELDKKAVASLFGVPGFMVGVGQFSRAEYNAFISSTLLPLCHIVEQELTKKLLYSDSRYFRFSPRSLYAYDLKELADIGDNQYIHGLMTGNEVRDWLGLSPKTGLDDLVILENFIPAARIGDQTKLNGGDDNADE